MSTGDQAACIPPPLERTDQKLACRSLSSTSLITMVGNEFTNEEFADDNKDKVTECCMRMPSPVTVCIPKVEPCYDSGPDSNEDLLNTDELIGSAIPFITPYKIKDPIILLEKCDKIWETLKLIKDVQSSKSTDTLNSVSLENGNHTSYIKYQPNVLGNNNVTLPNLKLCVKSTQRLYPCQTCGKLYLHKRDLRHHSAKIHGIFMSLDRPRNNVPGKQSVSKDKETSGAESEQSNVKKLNLKRSHIKQIKDSSPKSVKSNTNESNQESTSGSQSQEKKTNITTHTKDTLINSENVKKDQRKAISRKELNQNSTLSSSCKQCILCKYFVEDLRKHLVDYHKIQATDFMLKELEKKANVLNVNKSKNDIANTNNNNSLRNDPISNNKQQFQTNGKRKLNVSYTHHEKRFKIDNNISKVSSYQCDICSRLYRPHNIKRHLIGHRNRGETKENFHLINYDYSDPSDNGFEDRDKSNSISLFKNNKKGKRIPRTRKEFYTINDSKSNTTCSCGRSFRNPYTLYVHKRSCKLQSNEIEEYAIGSEKKTVGNSLAKINIKIKKRNDSYEIVGREGEKPEELADPCYEDTENYEQEDNEITGPSKYSDEHKFLKIAKIDEDCDIDVDIEENSQSGSTVSSNNNNSNNNNNNNDHLLTNELINQPEQKESEPITRRSSRSCRITSNVKSSSKSFLESHIIEKQNICVCGTLFDSRKALDVHTLKHQARSRLVCGYCDTTFPDIDSWKSHHCSHKKVKLFIDIPLEIDCHLCTTTFSSYTAFDEHIRTQHYDPMLPYLCFQCDKRFCNTTVRKNHINSEHDKYVCSMCDMTYTDKMKTRHEGYHYGLGYPCHVCKKTYSAKAYFNRHVQKTHSVRRSLNNSNLAS